MPITRPMPPAACAAAFTEGLLAFLAGPDAGAGGNIVSQNFVGAAPTIPTAAEVGLPVGVPPTANPVSASPADPYNPQQIFRVGLPDVINGFNISAARSVGWRFFAGNQSTKAVVMAKVVSRPPAGNWKMTAAYYGDQVRAALADSLALESLSQVQNSIFELRVLNIPAVNVEAFWLAPQTPGAVDLWVPFPSGSLQTIPALRDMQPYQQVAFWQAILPFAQSAATASARYGR